MKLKDLVTKMYDTEVLSSMQQWYSDVISGEWKYVVFVTNRGYTLAQIMESVTRKYMTSVKGTVYLTDASMLLCCEKFAQYYRVNGRFPRVLLCDDLLIHGRNLNHILDNVEKVLIGLLPEYDTDALKVEIAMAISIHVLIKTDAGSYVMNRYNANFAYKRYEKAARWHKLSSDLSSLMDYSNAVNIMYIYSQYLDKAVVEENILVNGDFVETIYQGQKSYTKVYTGRAGAKCVPVLQLIKNDQTGGYRAIPFVFFANLGADATELLYAAIRNKIMKKCHTFVSYIDYLYALDGKRSFSEFITFIMGITVLKELNMEYGLEQDFSSDVVQNEISKLARNYCRGDVEKAKELVIAFIENPIFDSVEELIAYFDTVPDKYAFFSCKSCLKSAKEEDIKLYLENKFYRSSWDDERETYLFFQNPCYCDENRFQRHTQDCALFIKNSIEDLGLGINDIKVFFGYFMQMIDAGIISVSSDADKDCKTDGLSQFVNSLDLALLIMPLRYYKYLPVLTEVDEFCELYRLERESMFEQIIQNDPESYVTASARKITSKELVTFLDVLKKIGQKPREWLNTYASRLDVSKSDDVMEQIGALFRYLDERDTIDANAKKVLNSKI